MNLLALRYFHSAARLKTISAAARHLRISQPALSKMIRALEEELGHRLLDRSRSGVTLTPAGQTVFQSSDRIFQETQSLQERLLDPRAPLAGTLRIGCSDNLAIHLFPKLFTRFKRSHSKLSLEIFTGTAFDVRKEMLADRCDLGFFFTPLRPGETELFESDVLLQTEFWVVLEPKLARVLGNRPTLNALRKHDLPRIESRRIDYQQSQAVAHFHGTALGFTSPAFIEVNNHEVKKALVLEGAGFGILTEHTVREEVEKKRLIRVPTPKPLLSNVYWARRKDSSHRASTAFLEAARALGQPR